MKHWKIHLVWAVLALVLGAGIGQILASRKEDAFRDRERTLRVQNRALRSQVTQLDKSSRYNESRETPPDTPLELIPEGTIPNEDRSERRRNEGDRKPLTPEQIRDLLKSKSRGSHWRALRGISEIKDRAEKIALLRTLFDVGSDDVKSRALRMLDDLGPPEGQELAIKVLSDKSPSWLQSRAARVLGELGGPTAILALQDSYRRGDLRLQTSSAYSLNRLGQSAPMRELITRSGTMLGDSDGAVREDAVETMGDLRDPSALPYLAQALQDPNSDVRRQAVDALEDIEVPESLTLLQQALNDSNPSVVRDAEQAIKSLKEELAEKKQ